MKRKSVTKRVYISENGDYYRRPWIEGRRTWRILEAKTLKAAIREEQRLRVPQRRRRHLDELNPTFATVADLYSRAGCPDYRLEPRSEEFCAEEAGRLRWLNRFFGEFKIGDICMADLPDYKAWRVQKIARGPGLRTVDKELTTLSSILDFAVLKRGLKTNPIKRNRPRFYRDCDIAHSRDFAPENGDELNLIAEHFFEGSTTTQVMGWLVLFAAMTGCRTIELRRLRLDAKKQEAPGFISGNYLFIRRAKDGTNPYVLREGEFAEMLQAFLCWHKEAFPKSPWFFPGFARDGSHKGQPVSKSAFARALQRACLELKLHKIRPHGLRSFYVTKRRGESKDDREVAAEIGDKTVSIISKTYGDVPPNWVGQPKLSFRPSKGPAAWQRWINKGASGRSKSVHSGKAHHTGARRTRT